MRRFFHDDSKGEYSWLTKLNNQLENLEIDPGFVNISPKMARISSNILTIITERMSYKLQTKRIFALVSSISQIQAEIAGEQETQQQLRQQIEEYRRKLKQAFAEHWQALRIKQV